MILYTNIKEGFKINNKNKYPQYLYAIRNKADGRLINRKCGSANVFYIRKSVAINKMWEDGTEEIATFALLEVPEGENSE